METAESAASEWVEIRVRFCGRLGGTGRKGGRWSSFSAMDCRLCWLIGGVRSSSENKTAVKSSWNAMYNGPKAKVSPSYVSCSTALPKNIPKHLDLTKDRCSVFYKHLFIFSGESFCCTCIQHEKTCCQCTPTGSTY